MNMKKQLIRTFVLFALLFPRVSFAGGEHQIFELGDFQLESGEILPSAFLTYVTHGNLNEEKDNLVLVPSAYLGDHHGFDFLIEVEQGQTDEQDAISTSQIFLKEGFDVLMFLNH